LFKSFVDTMAYAEVYKWGCLGSLASFVETKEMNDRIIFIDQISYFLSFYKIMPSDTFFFKQACNLLKTSQIFNRTFFENLNYLFYYNQNFLGLK